MVSQETQDFVFSVVDANQEYNTKLILFCIILIYIIFLIWWSNRIIPFNSTRDEYSTYPLYKQFAVRMIRAIGVVLIIFLPLTIGIFMYREFDLDTMITYLTIAYKILVWIGLGIFFLFVFDWVMDFLSLSGIEIKDRRGKLFRRRKE